MDNNMFIFLDTEFTHFVQCEMISIGMVSGDGHEFYFEITDYDKSVCSEFVQYEIIPMLGKNNARSGTKEQCAIAVREYLASVPCEKFTIIVDYYQDIELLKDLLDYDLGPKYEGAVYIQNMFDHMEANRALFLATEGYFVDGGIRHYALHDAKANRAGWLAAMKKIGVF